MQILLLLYVFASLARYTKGQCVSYGLDFVNGGSYFIDSTLATNFTFLSEFDGMSLAFPSKSVTDRFSGIGCDDEEITPILVDPDENEYFCSDIPTSPDLTSFLSTWYEAPNQLEASSLALICKAQSCRQRCLTGTGILSSRA